MAILHHKTMNIFDLKTLSISINIIMKLTRTHISWKSVFVVVVRTHTQYWSSWQAVSRSREIMSYLYARSHWWYMTLWIKQTVIWLTVTEYMCQGYVPFVVITIRSFPRPWLITGFQTRVALTLVED